MSEYYKEFIRIFNSRMVKSIIENGTPPAKKWPLPPMFIENSTIMIALLTQEGYELYNQLDKDEQKEAISYVENCGPELVKMVGCCLFDDWDKTEKIVISDEKIQELQEKYNLDI